jgi:hypothetical protein
MLEANAVVGPPLAIRSHAFANRSINDVENASEQGWLGDGGDLSRRHVGL